MSVKGFTYEIGQEQGVFSFSADAGQNTNVWFKKYSTPSAFEAEETSYGSSWSWMGSPGTVEAPNSGALNPETGAKLSVHQTPDGTNTQFKSIGSFNERDATFDGQYVCVQTVSHVYKYSKPGAVRKDNFSASVGTTAALTWDGEYFIIGNESGAVYQFTESGTNKGLMFKASIGSTVRGGAWDGSYLWMNSLSSSTTYRLKTDGTEVFNFANTAIGNSQEGITTDGTYLYITSRAGSGDILRYTKDGTHKDTFASPVGGPIGVAWDGEYLYDNTLQHFVYRYSASNSLDISYRVSSIV